MLKGKGMGSELGEVGFKVGFGERKRGGLNHSGWESSGFEKRCVADLGDACA
jgi:hypothetical protein|uniref:Uncharacterized protein n=1 Tax=Fagus sylvatica TaxID=28930 RepID=A0A2N9G8S7_FAGSY